MNGPMPLAQAWERLLANAAPLPSELLPVEQAVGRYLAARVTAARTQPAADLSAMDGYAVGDDDLTGPWRIVGESAAGHPYAEPLAAGIAIRVSTGALMPPGNRAVLLQENAQVSADTLALNGQGAPSSRHIRRAGFDFQRGDELLAAGKRIGAGQLALVLSGGYSLVSVHRSPKVAILDSGDELATSPEQCGDHQVPASNGAMLAAMVAPYAGAVTRLGPVADRMEALLAALESAGDADVVVTSGGASVGDHDLIRPALEQWGATIDFWRVAIKPGKPLLVARRGSQWIIGLPGNPVSSYVTAFLFLLPLLRALAGAERSDLLPDWIEARLTAPLPGGSDRREFLRAFYRNGEVTPRGEQDSSALQSLAGANALIEHAPNAPAAAASERVRVYLLDNGGIA